MIGHGQYGELQFGDRSKTWLSSGEKTSSNVNPTTSGLVASGDDTVTATDYGLSIAATSDIGDAVDLAEVVGKDYSTVTTSDTGNATDSSSSVSLTLSSVQAIDVPLSVDALITQYGCSPTKVSELATSIQKAIGSEQYGNFQWGAISVGLPTGRAVPAEYLFTPTETSDIGDSVIRSPSVEFNWSVQKSVDTGFATEIPDSISWNWGINIGSGLVVEIGDGTKVEIFSEPILANEHSSAIDLVSSTQEDYKLLDASDTGIGIDDVQVFDWNYKFSCQDEIGNTTLTGTPVDYALSVITSSALSVAKDTGSIIAYALTPESSSIIGNATDQVSPANYFLDSEITAENITVILTGTNVDEDYNPQAVSGIANTTDLVTSTGLALSPISTSDIGDAIDGVSSTGLTLVPVPTIDKGWILDEVQATGYDLSVLSSNVISSGTEQSSSTGMVYDPILVITEGFKVETIIITHDFNSEIIHTN